MSGYSVEIWEANWVIQGIVSDQIALGSCVTTSRNDDIIPISTGYGDVEILGSLSARDHPANSVEHHCLVATRVMCTAMQRKDHIGGQAMAEGAEIIKG